VKLHYYPETDSLYVEFQRRPSVDTREIAPDVRLDLDDKGPLSASTSTMPQACSTSIRSRPKVCRRTGPRPRGSVNRNRDATTPGLHLFGTQEVDRGVRDAGGRRRSGAMKLSYDPRHNVAYIRLREKGAEVETIRISDELNVDLAPDGTVYGIELLNANEQLHAADDGRLVVVEAQGKARTLKLALEPHA
jgi:uncharacterized protein YuzE